MKQALEDLTKVAKVFGSFVNDEDGNLVAYNMPSGFDENMLKEAGRISIQGFQGIESTGYTVDRIELEFSENRLINRRITGGVISVLCAKRISLPLLNLTFNVISKKIEEKLNKGDIPSEAGTFREKKKVAEKPKPKPEPKPEPKKEEPKPKPKPEPKPEPKKEEPKPKPKPKKSGKYVEKVFFDLLEEDFAKRIGPMAKFIIDDYVEEMGESVDRFPPDKVNDLITKLSSEIDKRTERGKFKQKMKAAFKKYK